MLNESWAVDNPDEIKRQAKSMIFSSATRDYDGSSQVVAGGVLDSIVKDIVQACEAILSRSAPAHVSPLWSSLVESPPELYEIAGLVACAWLASSASPTYSALCALFSTDASGTAPTTSSSSCEFLADALASCIYEFRVFDADLQTRISVLLIGLLTTDTYSRLAMALVVPVVCVFRELRAAIHSLAYAIFELVPPEKFSNAFVESLRGTPGLTDGGVLDTASQLLHFVECASSHNPSLFVTKGIHVFGACVPMFHAYIREVDSIAPLAAWMSSTCNALACIVGAKCDEEGKNKNPQVFESASSLVAFWNSFVDYTAKTGVHLSKQSLDTPIALLALPEPPAASFRVVDVVSSTDPADRILLLQFALQLHVVASYDPKCDMQAVYKNTKRLLKYQPLMLASWFSRIAMLEQLRFKHSKRRHLVAELEASDACLSIAAFFWSWKCFDHCVTYLTRLRDLHRFAGRLEAANVQSRIDTIVSTKLKVRSGSFASASVAAVAAGTESLSVTQPSWNSDSSLRALRSLNQLAQIHKSTGDIAAAQETSKMATAFSISPVRTASPTSAGGPGAAGGAVGSPRNSSPGSSSVASFRRSNSGALFGDNISSSLYALVAYYGKSSGHLNGAIYVQRVWESISISEFSRILLESYAGATPASEEDTAVILRERRIPEELLRRNGIFVLVMQLSSLADKSPSPLQSSLQTHREFALPSALKMPDVLVQVCPCVADFDAAHLPELVLRKPAMLYTVRKAL
eukprot:ANDGO_01616.mRNA.1 hypothetical protein